jgi:hypothetical protein
MPGASRDIDDAADASADMPELRLAKPSWRWRLLFCAAIVCAVVAVAVVVMPELFLSPAHAMVSHAKR